MKKGRISLIVIGIIVIITVILIVSLMTNLSPVDNDPKMGAWINYNLIWAYILLAVAAGAAVLFALIQMVTNPSSAKKAALSGGFMLVVILVSYLLASNNMPNFPGVQKFIDNGTLTTQISKWVDTGLIATYLLLGIAILSLVYASVSKLFNR